MLEPTVRRATFMYTPLNKVKGCSPCNSCDLTSLDVICNKFHLCRVTLDIDIVIANTDATVAQLLAL